MSDVRIFISCVSAEFGSYRDALRHYLTRPNVTVKVQEDFIVTGTETLESTRFVDNGRVITSSGVSAGIDMSLHVVGKIWGAEVARTTQKYMEYYPEPPRWD